MRLFGILMRGLASLSAFTASTAFAAEHLECVSVGYDADSMAAIEAFQDSPYSLTAQSDMPMPVLTAITSRAGQCADQYRWPAEAIEDAVLHQVYSITRVQLVRHSPFSDAQMQRLDQAIASADQQRLRAIVMRITDAALNGADAHQAPPADTVFFGRLILRSGVPITDENGKYAGAYIGTVIVPQVLAERFAAR